MKSFTAKEFSRCPAKVYEAAREDGKVEVAHDRFPHNFSLIYRDIENAKLLDAGLTQPDIDAAREKFIDIEKLMTHGPYKVGDYLAINKKDDQVKNKKLAKEISGEDWMGWRDLLHILSANINEFEGDAIKRIVLLINKKAPD